MKTFLNVGCGPETESKIRGFDNDDWKEIRLDIDEDVKPDIVGTLRGECQPPVGSNFSGVVHVCNKLADSY